MGKPRVWKVRGLYSDCCGSILCSCHQALSPVLPFCAARESDKESVYRSGFLFCFIETEPYFVAQAGLELTIPVE